MAIQAKPFRIMIGDGTAMPSTVAGITTGKLTVLKKDMTLLVAGQTVSDSDVIYIAQGTATAPLLSAPIRGSQVKRWSGEAFLPGVKQTTHIGYDRVTAQTINVLNSTDYSLDIVLKDDKDLFSQRQLRKVYFVTSGAAATALAILESFAQQIQTDINNSGELLPLQVIVVGDGSGGTTTKVVNATTITEHNVTAPTNLGLEISGTEYSFSQLKGYTKVYFEVGLNSGFDSTVVVTNNQAMNLGSGVYAQVYMKEDFGLQYSGFNNRRLAFFPQPTRYAANVGVANAIVPTVTTTLNDDEITFSANPQSVLPAGSIINIATYTGTLEIKYYKSATVAVCSAAANASVAGQAVTKQEFYSILAITHNDDSVSGSINGMSVNPPLVTLIASTAASAQLSGMEALLNPWMASTALAPANVTI